MAEINSMDFKWEKQIKNNFGNAALNYNEGAVIQKEIAFKLANLCLKYPIPDGIWVDLGSGTGILADFLEEIKPYKSIVRLDYSQRMLNQQNQLKQNYNWNLNEGLPFWRNRPTLFASSFALHWLNNPSQRLREWFAALSPGGWIALAVPIEGSFPEWKSAALKANVKFSAISFPSQQELLNTFSKHIRYQKLHKITQSSKTVGTLLKPIKKVGAQSSSVNSLSVGEWRQIQLEWPKSISEENLVLTWLIQIVLIQK